MRGQATSTRSFTGQGRSLKQQKTLQGMAAVKAAIRINLLFTIIAEQAAAAADAKLYFFRKTSRRHMGRRSKQPATRWWSRAGSNRRPPQCDCGALPAE